MTPRNFWQFIRTQAKASRSVDEGEAPENFWMYLREGLDLKERYLALTADVARLAAERDELRAEMAALKLLPRTRP